MTIDLRAPRLDELASLSQLCLRSKAHWGYDAEFMAACVEELTLGPEDIEQTQMVVAELDGELAGMAQVSFDGRYAELDKLFVDPPFIGHGCGDVLMRWAMQAAREAGQTRLMIASDPSAEPFYDRYGAARHGFMASASIRGRDLPWLAIDL